MIRVFGEILAEAVATTIMFFAVLLFALALSTVVHSEPLDANGNVAEQVGR